MSVHYDDKYRRILFRLYFGRYIPTELQTEYIEFKKKRRFADVEVFAGDFIDGITEGFKPRSPYSDVTNSPSELPTEPPIQGVRQ
jgi:hypothetical protein